VADVTAEADTRSSPYHFLIRRLHSLSGIVPVGVFLCIHLSVNACILAGADAFQFAVDQIHNLDNLGILKAVEITFIFVPILFHAILGLVIYLSGSPNVVRYRYGANIRYTLQRWTGIVAFLFIIGHLWHVHWIIPGSPVFDAHQAAGSAVTAMTVSWAAPVYAIGVLCAVFHFANGIWTFLISWGVTISPRSQMISGRACLILGVLLAFLGLGSLIKLKTMDASSITPRVAAETRIADAGGATGFNL
jgi:succinate dehydrogenase / fumarate reductase cytochrome b subunit